MPRQAMQAMPDWVAQRPTLVRRRAAAAAASPAAVGAAGVRSALHADDGGVWERRRRRPSLFCWNGAARGASRMAMPGRPSRDAREGSGTRVPRSCCSGFGMCLRRVPGWAAAKCPWRRFQSWRSPAALIARKLSGSSRLLGINHNKLLKMFQLIMIQHGARRGAQLNIALYLESFAAFTRDMQQQF